MTCPACDGYRLVQVSEATAVKMAGPLVVPPDATPELAERIAREHAQALATARNTVYPCRECNPAAFARWLDGAYASTLATNGRATRHPQTAPPPLPERRDLDR